MQTCKMGGKSLPVTSRNSVELEDMPEEVDLDHLGPNDAVTKDAVAADSDTEQTLCPDSASNGASKDGFQTPEGASGCCVAVSPRPTSQPHHHPPPASPSPTTTPNHLNSHHQHSHRQQQHHRCSPSPTNHHVSSRSPSNPRSPTTALPNGRSPVNKAADEDFKSEEEKIQEYLQRSDTAVIYPEPVDGETDAPNGHASPSPAPPTEEAPSNAKATEKDFYLKCPHCDQASSSIDALRSHLVTQHGASTDGHSLPVPPPDSGHSCDKCSATFALKDQLEKHELLHSPSAQLVNLDFIDGKGAWNAAHVTACKVCNKTFANVYRLQRHMISHDESAVLRKFKCPECEKAFKFKHHLKEHIRIHSGEKPFVCPNCGKRFSHSGSYSSHMTSKKCLVMNLKVPRRTVDKPVRPTAMGGGASGGGTNGRRSNQGGVFTPILPKYGENGLELSPGYVSGSGSSTGGSGSVLSPENFGLDFSHPFLPPYAPLHLNPLMAAATAANHFNSGLNPYALTPPLGSLGHVIRPSAVSAKQADEAKQPPTPPTPPKAEPPSSPPGAFTSSAYGDMNVVHRILAAVNATVSKQQQQGVGKQKNGIIPRDTTSPSLPPLTRSEAHSPRTPSPAASPQPPSNLDVKRNGLKSDDSHCRYCGQFFESKIDLHQHERYLCKLNGDIFPRPPAAAGPAENVSEHAPISDQRPPPPGWTKDAEASTSPRASSIGDGHEPSVNGYSEPDDDIQSDECADGTRDNQTDERKVRMRSLIADEHLAVLRAHYETNPRPSKEEVQRLAMQLKFSTRVVQVWFQNMRARDKKRGRTFQDSSHSANYSTDKIEGASNSVPTSIAVTPPPASSNLPVRPFSAITPTPFGPVIPHFNGVLPTPRLSLPLYYPPPTTPTPFPLRNNGHCSPTTTSSFTTAASLAPPFPLDAEQPLDLSVKSKERRMSSSSSCHSPASDQDGEVLNLSHKSSRTSTPCKESNNHVTTSYGFNPTYSSHANTTVIFSSPINTFSTSHPLHPLHPYHPMENSVLFKYMQHEGLLPSSRSLPTPPGLVKVEDPESAHMDDAISLASTNDLRIRDRKRILSPISVETPRLHQILASAAASSPPPLLQESSSLNGTVDSTGHVYSTDGSHSPCGSDREDQLEIDEVSDGKRIWKQIEGEDSQLDLDDSSLGDDDRPIKRRKSWKQHKLDSEEGLYACDQCDKVFSKQSSLARHKYEHSGQRPHKCDVCGKAFKHKHHLTEHKRLHSGEKPFQCKKCLKRFSHSGSYSQHMNHRYSYCKPYRE